MIVGSTIAHAQAVVPAVASASQAAPPTVTAVASEPAAAPVPAADAANTTTVAASDGVTREGGKYVKDSRPATKVEIAGFKKAEKSHHG